VRVARDGDLPRSAIHQLAARQFFDHVRIDMAGLHQLDAMLQPIALTLHGSELGLLNAEMSLDIFKLEQAALTPDGVSAEV
jgi:hypothetical protein